MPPKSLSLKKGQAGPPKNQKSITQFFKTTNLNSSQKSPEKTPILPSKCDDKPVKRKATSPICIETPKPVESCLSTKKDTHKKLKCDNRTHQTFKKSPCKENGVKKDKVLNDFDSLLFLDDVEIKGNNGVCRNNCTPKKNRSPLVPCVASNIGENILSILDDGHEIESNNHEKVVCQGKFSPNFYDLNDDDSFDIDKTPVKLLNGTPKKSSSVKSIKSPLKISKSHKKCGKVLEFGDQDVDSVFGDDWAEDMNEDVVEDLDLSTMQRCTIESVTSHPHKVELRLKNSTNNRGYCCVDGIWLDTPLQTGDTISILASRDASGCFSVTNTTGLIVLRPDRLISSTSVVAGVFCKRKAVLQERWRGIDSANSAMTIGILVHELVQKALTQNIKTVDLLRKEAGKILKESIQSLYDAGLSEEEACSNIQQYISPLAEFMQVYMSDKPPPNKGQKDRWCGNIDKVLDIEENLCCPELGLRAK
ncbi:uncharacterized protein [Choristoneura fumiferana]|uniref:uncharacterized protein n=1 Tax=Choristoneura fumiferana TaxID=7141 RepID=UPI003D1580DF